jgi:hypothetical protein
MAAFTSRAAGDWSSGGQTTWTQTGVPGDGDTTTITHAITISANTTVGASPATGGTQAILLNAGGSLSITGGTLTLKGDIKQAGANTTVTMSAGTGVTFKPAASATYKWDFGTNSGTTLTCNGSSGSHVTIQTDTTNAGSGQAYFAFTSGNNQGCTTATYTDLTNMGTSTSAQWGFGAMADKSGSDVSVSITNCTFTHSNCQIKMGTGTNNWDANFTFTNNTFTSSVTNSESGTAGCCFISFHATATNGTRLFQYNSLDAALTSGSNYTSVQTVDNYFGAGYYFTTTGAWGAATNFARNFINITLGAAQNVTSFGDMQDNYFYHSATNNPHFVGGPTVVVLSTMLYKGLIFDTACSDGTGDCIFPNGTSGGNRAVTVKGCIVLPHGGASGATAGKLLSTLQSSTSGTTITCEHNTYAALSGEGGLVQLDETLSSYAGEITSCRSNIIWSGSHGSPDRNYAINDLGSGTIATDAVTVAGYNGFLTPTTGTITANGSSTSATGYNGIKVSGSGFPSSQVGTGDFTADPKFLDNTRNMASYAQTFGGADGTASGGITYFAANPSKIGTMVNWVREGFRPTNGTYLNTTYGGDTYTTDSNGNPMVGAVGAMGPVTGAPSGVMTGGNMGGKRGGILTGGRL